MLQNDRALGQIHRCRWICPKFGYLRSLLYGVLRGTLVWGAMPIQAARADYPLNLTPGATSTSRLVYDLHMLSFWICVGIGALVFGTLTLALVRHRKSLGRQAASFRQNLPLELIWTLVPLLILAGMAVAATRTLVLMEDTSDADLTIKVTGYQWRWHYDYLDRGVDFFSSLATDRKALTGEAPKDPHYLREVDRPLVLPVGKKVRFLTTSNDVIHSWWVPALGWKKDAIPGFINEAWARIERPGIYRGQCAELCGRDHAFMPIVVEARDEAEFQDWLEQQQARQARERSASNQALSREGLISQGKQTYMGVCAACHQANGKGIPGSFPSLVASKVVAGPLDAHLKVVLNGRPGTAMQAFAGQLSDQELAAVVSYERHEFGGQTNLVRPNQVKAARQRLQASQ